jgi:hypothetical protein
MTKKDDYRIYGQTLISFDPNPFPHDLIIPPPIAWFDNPGNHRFGKKTKRPSYYKWLRSDDVIFRIEFEA